MFFIRNFVRSIKFNTKQSDDARTDSKFWLLINKIIALSLLLILSPVFLFIIAAIKIFDKGPVFYKGARLGYNKQLFDIYKFRTLVPNAESLIGANLVNSNMGYETVIGKFLRDTRLDELPQLFNILKADMLLIGPRPERPIIYEEVCKSISNYDLRFSVRPGLVGYSQIFTPHSSNKRLRARIDNYYIKRNKNFYSDLSFFVSTLGILGNSAFVKLVNLFFNKALIYHKQQRLSDMRKSRRNQFDFSYNARVNVWFNIEDTDKKDFFRDPVNTPNVSALILDMNDTNLIVISDVPLVNIEQSRYHGMKLVIKTNARSRGKRGITHTAYCQTTDLRLNERRELASSYRYQLSYKPISALDQYKVDKYFLYKSIL